MPSSIMDQRKYSPVGSHGSTGTSSFFSEELLFPTERQVGFWKPELVPDDRGKEEILLFPGSKSVSSSPFDKLHLIRGTSQNEVSQPYLNGHLQDKLSLGRQLMGLDKMNNIFAAPWGASKNVANSGSDLLNQHASSSVIGRPAELRRTQFQNGVLPNTLSDAFHKQLTMSSNNVALGQSIDVLNSNIEEDEPFESMEEIEAQTIGDLLPNDDELLSGVVDNIVDICRPANGEDVDDDIFYSGGGMELEADEIINDIKASELIGGGFSNSLQGVINGTCVGEHPSGEHPSRTLFVRNINSNVEDTELKDLFEQYGDIRALYTACKHRGFVMIAYYDIRSACNAMRALQNKPLRRRKLDIHFSIPKDNPSEKDINQGTLVVFNLDTSVSNEDLRQIFGIYGEVKEIRETPHKIHHKFIEFYDVRAAEAALRALNRSDIAGKKIKLQPSRPGGARRLVQQSTFEVEQDGVNGCKQGSPSISPSGCSGSVPNGAITANSVENGGNWGLQSAVRAPISPFMDSAFHGISSSVPQNMSSPIRITSLGNHNNQAVSGELSHSLGQMNFRLQGMPSFHPHSLPEHRNGVANGLPYTSSNSISAVGMNIRPSEGNANMHLNNANTGGPNSNSFDHNNGSYVASSNGSCPVHGHQYAWNNTNAFQHHLPGPAVWSNSLPFLNKVSAHPPSQMHGIPRAPPQMMKTVMSPHHVGSAPTVDPTLWDRRHTYNGDAADSPAFHPGSLGTIGLTGSPQFHQLELASRSIFTHAGGNCMDPSVSSAHIGIPSPQHKCQIYHGRNHMIPMPGSFDSPSDRMRSRRNDTNANQADNKKQYELDIERIVRGEDSRTTLMLKNIPNKYTSKMLLAAIDENHRGIYDFIYLPIDFKNKCNVGYAFINMTDPQNIVPFYQSFNGKKWEKFNSEKVASLAYARIQGKSALIAHFQNSSLMNEDKRCRPILFQSDGPNAGDQEPFPIGMNIRSRSGRSRTTSSSEEQLDGSPPASSSGEASCYTTVTSSSTKDRMTQVSSQGIC